MGFLFYLIVLCEKKIIFVKIVTMALTTVNVKTTFDYTASPKVFKFEDLTDYAGQSIALTNVVGVIKVVAPSGTTIYDNTNFSSPDIDPDVSLENSTTIQLPLLADGSVMQGTYTITYTVRVSATTLVPAYNVSVTKTINFQYARPTINLTISANVVAPLLKSTDETSYTIVTPTGAVDPTIVRDHRLFYPATLNLASINGTGQVVSTSTFYTSTTTLQYSSSITSTLTYNLGNDFYILDSISGIDTYDLSTAANLCELYCGINKKYQQWQNNKGTTMGNTFFKEYEQILVIAMQVQIAIDCGKDGDIAGLVTEMKRIGGFNEECVCDGGTPTLVTGTGGSGTVVVQAGTGTSVSSTTSGNTTTYTVSLSAANVAKLAAAYNSVVAAGTGTSVSVATAADGTKTYTVNSTVVTPELLTTQYTIAFTAGALPNITKNSSKVYGTVLTATTLAEDTGVAITYANVNNSFTVSGFNSTSANYICNIELVESSITGSSSALKDQAKPLDIRIIDKNSQDFKFQFIDVNGNPVNGNDLDITYSSVTFNLTIIA